MYEIAAEPRADRLFSVVRRIPRCVGTRLIFSARHNICPHFSGIIVLLSNVLIQPVQLVSFEDFQLAATSIEVYNQLLQDAQSLVLDSLRQIIKDLHSNAAAVISETQLGQRTPSELNPLVGDADGQLYNIADNFLDRNSGVLGLGSYENIVSPSYGEELFVDNCNFI